MGGTRQVIATEPVRNATGNPVYLRLVDFLLEDARRMGTCLEFGISWHDCPGVHRHRVCFHPGTGELTAERWGEQSAGPVEVIAVMDEAEDAEEALAGWRDELARGGDLAWVRERVSRLHR